MYFLSAFVAIFSLSFIESSHQQTTPSFEDVLSSQKNLTSFKENLTKYHPELLAYIGQQTIGNPITVLAPSNAAFSKTTYYSVVGPAFANKDIGAIQAILSYHVVIGNHPSNTLLPTFQYFQTWLSNSSFTNVTDGQRVGAVMQRGTEMIWASGTSTRSPAVSTDIAFSGGTLHIVDSLLVPPSSLPTTAELFSTAAEPYQLTSFLGAIYYNPSNASLPSDSVAAILNKTGDITIFVPNNVAMESVHTSLTDLSNNPIAFNDLLEYHIVKGSRPTYSTDLSTNGTTLQALNGKSLDITFSSNSYFVNGARLLTSDLLLDNGVMHVIDNVLSPSNMDEKPNPSLATQKPALSTQGHTPVVSAAPFTTWLPNTVNTVRPTGTAGSYSGLGVGSGAAATTSDISSAQVTGTGRSAGVRVVPFALWVLGVGSTIGLLVV